MVAKVKPNPYDFPPKITRTKGGLISIFFFAEIKTVSEANQREFWAAKYRRKVAQQQQLDSYWMAYVKRGKVKLPCEVILTRIGPNALDSDNLAGSMKHVRDQLAKIIGVDDADPRIRFKYEQTAVGKRIYGVIVDIQHRDTPNKEA